MVTLLNLGYLALIYFLMLLTALIDNSKIELVVIIIVVISTFFIYFWGLKIFMNCLEKKIMGKLEINIDSKDIDINKYKIVNVFSYIGYGYLMIFVTDNKNNLVYKARLKGNITQNYIILNNKNKRVGHIYRLFNNYYTKLNKGKGHIFIQKFLGSIQMVYQSKPIQIYYNAEKKRLELHSTKKWSDIYSQMKYKKDNRIVSGQIKLNDSFQNESILFYLTYIARFYYPGNK